MVGLGLFKSDEIQEGIPVQANQEAGKFPESLSLLDDKTSI